jgi:hypothetical protein
LNPIQSFLARQKHLAFRIRWKIFARDLECRVCGLKIEQVLIAPNHNNSWSPCAIVESEIVWFNVDHIVPRSKGGTNKLWNLRTTCQPCNEKKADQDIYILYGVIVPSDFENQILKKQYEKELKLDYPAWKPYYGF